jgi:hypothetical protein
MAHGASGSVQVDSTIEGIFVASIPCRCGETIESVPCVSEMDANVSANDLMNEHIGVGGGE